MIVEALMLGFSSGTYCTMYCGPVLIPFLCGTEKSSLKRNATLTGIFLISRLAMYFILGCIFGAAGLLVSTFFDPVLVRHLSMYAYIFCGLALLLNSLGTRFPWAKDGSGCKCKKLRHIGNDWLTAIFTGLAVGLHLCPPLWTAITRSFFGNGSTSIFYLIFFYIGTLPFFIPLLGIPFLSRLTPMIKRIARIAQFLIGLYFIVFAGLIPLFF